MAKRRSEKKLGFAVIGLGNFGLKRLQTIQKSPRARAVSVHDSNVSKAKRISDQIGAEVQSFSEILENSEVDVVNIATPNDSHIRYCLETLRAGKVAWCEKPLGRTDEDCRQLLDVVRKCPRRVKVGSPVRYLPNILKLRTLGVRSCIGRPLYMRAYLGTLGRQLRGASWYTRRERIGGGALLDLGVHLIDLTRCLLGEVESCNASLSNDMWHLSSLEDLALCAFDIRGGVKAAIQVSWHEWCGYMYLEILGTRGFIRSDNRSGAARLQIGNREKVLNEYDFSNLGTVSYSYELEHFIDSYLQSHEPTASAYDGYRSVRIVGNCYESALSKKTVSCVA